MSYYVANLSMGKDSTAMVLWLIEKGCPLDECVFFHMGEVEFECMSVNAEKMRVFLESKGIKFTILHPEKSFTYMATEHTFQKRDGRIQHGYYWCARGKVRWGTALKCGGIERYLRSLGRDDIFQYIGIASDESRRAEKALIAKTSKFPKLYPLIDWGMTEAQCLEYCREQGWKWEVYSQPLGCNVDLYYGVIIEKEDGTSISLPPILDRCSCFCCGNKNLREASMIFRFLPDYWAKLEDLQRHIQMPYRRDGKTVFDLRKRFEQEAEQVSIFDI